MTDENTSPSQYPKRYGRPDTEVLDTTPIEMPIGSMRPTPLNLLIAQMVQSAIQAEKNEEFESFEESEDFADELEEGLLDMSPYQLTELQEDEPIDEMPPEEPPVPVPPPEPTPEPPVPEPPPEPPA